MTMNCKRCKKEIPDGSPFCNWCGAAQVYQRKVKGRRSNGEGTAVKMPNGTYRLILTEFRYGRRVTKSKSGFKTKGEAYKYLPVLREQKTDPDGVTFRAAFDRFIETHKRSKQTIQCYTAAFQYFAPLHDTDIAEIDLEGLQACLDNCPHGKRTKQNMRTICGLVYKFMIPRYPRLRDLNLGEFLKIYNVQDPAPREAFTPEQLEKIRQQIGRTRYADYVYCQCYLGFRPSELLSLTRASYSAQERVFTGGAKTDAGRGRKVTVPPKIQPYIDALVLQAGSGYIFRNQVTGGWLRPEPYRTAFDRVLEAAGIDNPVINGRKKYTPHTCRHTFATMVKRIQAPEKDILELIGHTDISMTMDYQDVSLEDLRKITDMM